MEDDDWTEEELALVNGPDIVVYPDHPEAEAEFRQWLDEWSKEFWANLEKAFGPAGPMPNFREPRGGSGKKKKA